MLLLPELTGTEAIVRHWMRQLHKGTMLLVCSIRDYISMLVCNSDLYNPRYKVSVLDKISWQGKCLPSLCGTSLRCITKDMILFRLRSPNLRFIKLYKYVSNVMRACSKRALYYWWKTSFSYSLRLDDTSWTWV